MIRVFPHRTKWTPTDELAFVGDPPFDRPQEQPVKISVTFTWHIEEGKRLQRAWGLYYQDVELGGPAFGDPGGEFISGRFIKEGVTITSRGCCWNNEKCPWCFVPDREGKVRLLDIKDGHICQDNNLLACSRQHLEKVFEMFRRQKDPIEITGGIDAVLLKAWHVDLLKSIRINQLFLACDHLKAIPHLERAADLLSDIPKSKKRCYVLIGHDGETIQQAERRLEKVFDLGFIPSSALYQGKTFKDYSSEWTAFNKAWCRPAATKAIMKKKAGIQTAQEKNQLGLFKEAT